MGSLVKDRKEAPGDSKEGEESARGPERTITGPPFIVVTAPYYSNSVVDTIGCFWFNFLMAFLIF